MNLYQVFPIGINWCPLSTQSCRYLDLGLKKLMARAAAVTTIPMTVTLIAGDQLRVVNSNERLDSKISVKLIPMPAAANSPATFVNHFSMSKKLSRPMAAFHPFPPIAHRR